MVAAVTGLVADAVSVGLLVVNAEGRVVWVNAALAAAVGVEPSGPGRAAARAAVAAARLPLSGLVAGGPPVEAEWTAPDGSRRWLRLRRQQLTPPGEGFADGLVLYELIDLTEVYAARASAQPAAPASAEPETGWPGITDWEQPTGAAGTATPATGAGATAEQDRVARIEQLTRTGTWDWDLATGEVSFSRNLLVLLGFDPDAPASRDQVIPLLPDGELRTVERAVGPAIDAAAAGATDGASTTFTYINRIRHNSGHGERVFECFGEVLTDGNGRPARVIGTAHDITDLHRIQQELAHLAEHDPLTGLFNRRAITRALREHLAAGGPGRPGSLLIIDVDHFKDINDLRGHAVGDTVMRGLTQVLRDELPDAVLGRLGGDEFAVLLPTGDGAAGLAVATRLCHAVASQPIPIDDAALRVTVSIGVAPLAHVEDDTAALAQADLALYDAKGAGRDCARLFTTDQYDQAALRVSVTQRLRAALDAGTLGVDALPLVDLTSRQVIGFELLVRLRDGRSPELTPREFLPPVERTELVLRLDRWVVGQAVAALAADGPHGTLYLHVNISARSAEDPLFADFVLDSLRAAGVDPARLGLEIAERSTLVSIEPARRLADKLTAAGCRFILDDFGVGMGSVVHLRSLPFNGVKIDGDFVRQADVNPQDIALVDAVVRIARTLGMYTIAENVDREPLARVLAEIGVDYAQGYHVGPPRPLPELLAERAARLAAPPAPERPAPPPPPTVPP
ncbi:MAG: EAL domain-containing protein, partial [Frankia sp.]|nr:EAL domain-containing protein [Frankia sp.]